MVSVAATPFLRFSQRIALAAEAVFPVAAQQAYIWLVPHGRPRWWDATFAALVVAIVVVYVGRRGLLDRRTFGLGKWADQRRAFVPVLIFTLVVIAGLLVWGSQDPRGLRREWDVLGSLALYPLWGFIQQSCMFGVVYPRCRLLAGEWGAIVLTAVLFGLAHAPNPLLMFGGAGIVFFYGLVWRKAPSLPAIAVSHGWIGAITDKALHVSMRVGAHYFTP